MVSATPVLVVGGGVAGLTCALELLAAGYSVQVAARELQGETTSAIAAAFWYPYCAYPEDQVNAWAHASLRRFLALAEDASTGVIRRETIELGPFTTMPSWADAVPGFHRVAAEELPPGHAEGFAFSSTVVETGVYLRWLQAQIEARGGQIVQRTLTSLDEAEGSAIVVNCSGLGARDLVPDPQVHPIRGQVVRVENLGFTRVWLDEHSGPHITYIVPRSRDVVLGGTSQPHADDRTPDPECTREILERCARIEPRLAEARVLSVAVGLRPGRPAVRLEAERRGATLVVHNYGHGGAGVTLSWGCAAAVREIVEAHR